MVEFLEKNGKLIVDGKEVIKGWRAKGKNNFWLATQKDEETHQGAPLWFGFVKGSKEEWGLFSEAELNAAKPNIEPIPDKELLNFVPKKLIAIPTQEKPPSKLELIKADVLGIITPKKDAAIVPKTEDTPTIPKKVEKKDVKKISAPKAIPKKQPPLETLIEMDKCQVCKAGVIVENMMCKNCIEEMNEPEKAPEKRFDSFVQKRVAEVAEAYARMIVSRIKTSVAEEEYHFLRSNLTESELKSLIDEIKSFQRSIEMELRDDSV